MDAFFASIEQRDFPHLKGKPVVVGSASDRGVIAAASYEARKFGVRSAMPSKTALKRCPHLVFQPHRFDVYKAVSRQIMDIFYDYTDLVEPLSLDEAFLDVTENKKEEPSATIIAKEIKARIFEVTSLTASAGVSVNKFLAKVASDQRKPDGLFVIKPKDVMGFIENLPIQKFFGVGKKTAEKMHSLNIHKGKDLQKFDLVRLVHHFGKAGHYFYEVSRGEDNRPVRPHRVRKSVGIENTFLVDIVSQRDVYTAADELVEGLVKRLKRVDKAGKTVTLKVKFNDFDQITRSKTVERLLKTKTEIQPLVYELIQEAPLSKPIRLLGVTVSNFPEEKYEDAWQLKIDFDAADTDD